MKKILALMLAVLMVFSLSACGTEDPAESTEDNPSSEESAEGGFDYSSLTIAGIVFQNDEFCRILQQGYQAAAADYGVTLLEGNSNDSIDKEIELVNTYIASEVDGIVVSIMDADASVTALQNAYDAGIAVSVTNTRLNADFPVCTVESSQADLGKYSGMYAREVLESYDEDIKIGIIEFATLIPANSNPRVENFLAELEGLDYEGRQRYIFRLSERYAAARAKILKERGRN